MARDVSNPKQNARLRQLEKLRSDADDAALAAIMDTADGRRVLTRFARDCRWMGRIWDAGSPRQTDHNAGKQEAASDLMEWAERVNPGQFMAALAEATKRDVEMADLAKAALTPTNGEDDG